MPHKKLRILFVTPYVPASNRLRPYRFIKELVHLGHSVVVVCLVQPGWEYKFVDELKPLVEAVYPVIPNRLYSLFNILVSLPSNIPLSVAVSSSRQLHGIVKGLLAQSSFDLIHTEFVRAGQYTADFQGIPKLYDAVDSLALAYHRALKNKHTRFEHRLLAFEEWLKMRSYETGILHSFNRVIVSSPSDQSYLVDHGTPVDVLPNGVDLDYYHWMEEEKEADSIVFLGKMNYYVNVDSITYFAKFIYPLIKAQRPGAHLTIVGYNPDRTVRNLSRDPSIVVTGGVPDVRPYFARSMVAIAPMISGSGIQNKILQAMAVGTPVVTTSLACQALQVTPGEHLLVADTPEQFAQAVVAVLKDKSLQKKLSANARRYVEECHNWNVIGQRLEDIYMEML